MRYICLTVVLVFSAMGIDGAVAQRKKNTDKQSEQPAPQSGGLQSCEGGLFFIEEGGLGPRCQRSDGKTCQIRGGTSGQAIVSDCK